MDYHALTPLTYAVRLGPVGRYLGQLTLMAALLNLMPGLVALALGEYSQALPYLSVSLAAMGPAALLARLPEPRELQTNEALVVTALAFLVGSALMIWPFMAAGLTPAAAVFEAVSGITTTGLSTLASVEGLPRSFLFARAWLQWYSGLGVVVLTLVLLIGPGATARRLAGAGGDPEDLIGTSRLYARRVAAVYLALTLATLAIALPLGNDPFAVVVHVLAAVSTAGFSSFDDSLVGLGDWGIRWALLGGSLAGAVPFVLYYHLWRGNFRQALTDRELLALMGLTLLLALGLGASLVGRGWALDGETVQQALATAVTAQSTTGFSTLAVGELPPEAKGLLILAMFSGGCLGSTAGGIKLLRLLILVRLLQILVRRTALPPHAVVPLQLGHHPLGEEELQRALGVVLLYGLTVVALWLPFLVYGYDPLDALFEVASAAGTVGLSTGISAPELPLALNGALCGAMLLGRLEVLALLVLLSPGSWLGIRRTR